MAFNFQNYISCFFIWCTILVILDLEDWTFIEWQPVLMFHQHSFFVFKICSDFPEKYSFQVFLLWYGISENLPGKDNPARVDLSWAIYLLLVVIGNHFLSPFRLSDFLQPNILQVEQHHFYQKFMILPHSLWVTDGEKSRLVCAE